MDTAQQNKLALAAHLMANHWLGQAKDMVCDVQNSLPEQDAICTVMLEKLDAMIQSPQTLNLSLAHVPITHLTEGRILSTLHLTQLTDPLLKQLAFKQGVYYIDVETSSQCNRKCHYCPNATNDRLSFNQFMDKAVYEKLINDLATIGYDKSLHFVGYNEPLMHKDSILANIAYAREKLPHATLKVLTNGDYLDAEYLKELAEAGVNKMLISIHQKAGEPFDDGMMITRVTMLSRKLNIEPVIVNQEKNVGITVRLPHDKIFIEMYQRNYMEQGHNRGGLLENVGRDIHGRTAACTLPVTQFIVGYQGTVIPCCVLVGDDLRHAEYRTGTIDPDASIFDIYTSEVAVAWRRHLLTLKTKDGPCKGCSAQIDSPQHNNADLYGPLEAAMDILKPQAA